MQRDSALVGDGHRLWRTGSTHRNRSEVDAAAGQADDRARAGEGNRLLVAGGIVTEG